MKFSFWPISDPGVVPLTAGDSGKNKEKKPRSRKTQQSGASRPPSFGSHESFRKTTALKRSDILLQLEPEASFDATNGSPKIDEHIDYFMVRIDPDKITPLKSETQSKDT